MKIRVVLATLIALLFTVMIFGSPTSAAPADPEAWAASAEEVDVKDLGGVVVKAVKISDRAAKPLDLVDQCMAASFDCLPVPKSSFNPGDSCHMILVVETQQAGTVSGLFLWLGDAFKLFRSDSGIWWTYDLNEPGTWCIGIYFTNGCPDWPGSYKFLGGVKASWGKNWGFFRPSPFPFVIN